MAKKKKRFWSCCQPLSFPLHHIFVVRHVSVLSATSSVFTSHLCIYFLFKCNKNRLCELPMDSSFNCLSHRLKRLLPYCIKKLKSQHTLERQMWIPLNCSLFSVLACGNAALPLVAVKGILFVMKQIFWSVTCCQSGFNHQVLLACIWPVTPVNCALFRPTHCLMTWVPIQSCRKISFWLPQKYYKH